MAEKKGIVMITAYDASMASLVEEAGVDWILVGDSLGMVVQGEDSTRPVTMDQMLYHTEMVRRGAPKTKIIADLPYGAFDSPEIALVNSRRLRNAGADAVKFEGGLKEIALALHGEKIDFMGHLGLLPQTAKAFRVQGKDDASADQMKADARVLEQSGAFSLVLECVPEPLAQAITDDLSIPTIGIGAGRRCSGQVLVLHDLLGLTKGKLPKFVKRYADLRTLIHQAVTAYGAEVRGGQFPEDKHVYH